MQLNVSHKYLLNQSTKYIREKLHLTIFPVMLTEQMRRRTWIKTPTQSLKVAKKMPTSVIKFCIQLWHLGDENSSTTSCHIKNVILLIKEK